MTLSFNDYSVVRITQQSIFKRINYLAGSLMFLVTVKQIGSSDLTSIPEIATI